MLLPHHLVVRVHEVTAGVVSSPRVELWPVLHPARRVVHCHLGPGHLGLESVASRQDNSILHLNTAGIPDNELILAHIYTSALNRLTLDTLHRVVTYSVRYLRGKLVTESPVLASSSSVV